MGASRIHFGYSDWSADRGPGMDRRKSIEPEVAAERWRAAAAADYRWRGYRCKE
ncbi:hypothetical protein [Nocardia arthritidis]|uniref:Uncharacterized protein n=1 Tax=Nocardia arthritidis TaxID=228602 RepID=A0A6G9YQL3_9NOCA|nr:hypothetical protein [Nocardia arthritidis]QIS15203.1 hypothetical protein F5544_36875 [Nocardia arthritidis]